LAEGTLAGAAPAFTWRRRRTGLQELRLEEANAT
jgi:hypothetical protein